MTVRAQTKTLVRADFTSLQPYSQYPYALLVSQTETEQILEQRLNALGVSVLRPYRAVSFEGTNEGTSVTFESGEVIKTRFLVGADGARSLVSSHSPRNIDVVLSLSDHPTLSSL